MFKEYTQYDGLGLAELVRSKQVQPRELVETAIQRIEALNPRLNAVIHTLYDDARKAADAPLTDAPFAGVPFLIKDLLTAYKGAPMRSGSRFFKDYVPDYDSELMCRYRASGVITLGKTNTPEFGLIPVTEPELFGPTLNPWDQQRTAGGSSGGSAAAVAAGFVPLAGGGDGGGSIRIPASCCGIFGLKPTRGRVPTGPVMGEMWHGFVIEGVLSRSVRDTAAMLDVISGGDVGAPYFAPSPARPFLSEVSNDPGKLRIAYTTTPFMGSHVHPDCVRAVEETVKLLTDLGHEVVQAEPKLDKQMLNRAFFTIIAAETRADLEQYALLFKRQLKREDFELTTYIMGLIGKTISATDLSLARRVLGQVSRQVGQFFEGYDLLLTPTLSEPAPLLGSQKIKEPLKTLSEILARMDATWAIRLTTGLIDQQAQVTFEFIPYPPLFNITGQPAMSVPLYWNAQNIPVGVQFAGRYADEATLLRLAGQLEKAKPWFNKLPPIAA